jgi:hypothetical protein
VPDQLPARAAFRITYASQEQLARDVDRQPRAAASVSGHHVQGAPEAGLPFAQSRERSHWGITTVAAERDAYEVLEVDPKAHPVVLRAAHHALASLYHPDLDQSGSSTPRMAELNQAWEKVRTPERRELYDRQRAAGQPAPAAPIITPQGPTPPAARPTDAGSASLDFGRYRGWTLAQLAREDPEYLQWLSRHSSGLRYRSEIEHLLREQSTKRSPGFGPR